MKLLPAMSRRVLYIRGYEIFVQWKTNNGVMTINNEDVILVYLYEK